MTAQNMGKKILTDGGYDVVTVSNGAAALKKLAEFSPDLIIADVYMPGYNGLEICERVKKASATASVPVLLSVGKLEPFRPEDGIKVHADGIIIKPFEATDLLAVTAKLAERASKAHEAAHAAPAAQAAEAPEIEAAPEGTEAAPAKIPVSTASNVASQSSAAPAFALDEPAAFAVEEPAQGTATSQTVHFELAQSDAAPFTLSSEPQGVEPSSQIHPATEVQASATFTAHTSEPTATVLSFTIDESTPVEAPSFAADHSAGPDVTAANAQPDYVREFGLASSADPHDAPTTMFALPVDHTEVSDPPASPFESMSAAAEEHVASAPATLNAEINEVTFSAPEPEGNATDINPPEDDFEAKLAAAMAEYDMAAPAETSADVNDDPAAPQAIAASNEPESASTRAVANWVAEEVPISDSEKGLSLESELRAYAAAAGTATTVSMPTAPVGPMGDTSLDDEVASIVEESHATFFPNSKEHDPKPAQEHVPAPERHHTEFAIASDVDGALSEPQSFEPAEFGPSIAAEQAVAETADIVSGSLNVAADSFVVSHDEPDTASELFAMPKVEDFAAATDIPSLEAPSELVADIDEIPELLTHDIPSEWSVPLAHATAESSSVPVEVEPDLVQEPALAAQSSVQAGPAIQAADDFVVSHHDFVSDEAPFAHEAIDAVDVEGSPSALSAVPEIANIESALHDAGEEMSQAAVKQSAQAAATIDQATVADVVERVMERMKGEIVSQIAKELAAKIGK